MSYRIKIFTLVFVWLFITLNSEAQNVKLDSETNRHSIHISYSDGTTLSMSTFLGLGMSDAWAGMERQDLQSSGVYGIGYRYALHPNFKVGAEIGFARLSGTVINVADRLPVLKEKELNLLILPTAELVYLKRKIFTLYGSVGAGILLNRCYESVQTGKRSDFGVRQYALSRQFAFQFNPLGLRIGNERVGGLIETGLGHRGLITIGVCLNC